MPGVRACSAIGAQRGREHPRGERVVPGVWRLRLPLPWPGVPHGNAFAGRAGDGIVLFDTGYAARTAPAARPRARPGRRADRRREPARLHPRPHRPLRARGPDRRCRRLRALDAPRLGARARAADDPDGALDQRIEVARQSGVPAEALERYERSRRGANTGSRGSSRRPPLCRGSRSRPTSAPGRCMRPRPRALARRPSPARERAADLRRPPARPGIALLRLRPHARPGRRVPGRPGARRAAQDGPLPRRSREAVSRRSTKSAANSARGRAAARARAQSLVDGPRTAFEVVAEMIGPRTSTRPPRPGACRCALAYLDHLGARDEVIEVEGAEPRRWEAS